jgi:DNA-binding NarL/FixJ family response regulator
MAFTGDLEHLHIVDIIQLLHTTRKSGTFSVKGSRGESRIIFSNGYIVGASHLNNRIRIGTVLVKMDAITREDLKKALDTQKSAGKDRKPLIATLIELGKLSREEASKGLRKLIEITIVELMNWSHGTFTVDTEDIEVTPECSYPIVNMEQATSLDAQMVLMDALRVFDERERDRQSGKEVPSYEEMYADAISPEVTEESKENGEKKSILTADDLGLGELDHLERKIPQFSPVDEIFNPVAIHRQKIKEILADFSDEEQEAFVSLLEKSRVDISLREGAASQQGRTLAIILFSEDELIKHSVMTICKNAGVLVFTTDGEEELDNIVAQCLLIKTLPILVLDNPGISEGMLTKEKIVSLLRQIRGKYSRLAIIQMASPGDYSFTMQAYQDGARAVLPKPSRGERKEGFIQETIQFLDTFKSYIKGFYYDQQDTSLADNPRSEIKDRILAIREIHEPSQVSFSLLQSVAECFERSITFIVRQTELTGEKALGVYAEKDTGPVSAAKLKIPLTRNSVFRDVIEKGQVFYGESDDEVLKEYLLAGIGAPLNPTIILLPLKSNGKTMTITYGDFGSKEAAPVQSDDLVIMANQAGLVIENILYRKMLNKASHK